MHIYMYVVQRHNIPRDLDGSVVVGAEGGASKNWKEICNHITSISEINENVCYILSWR